MAYSHDAFPFPMEHQPQAMYFHHPLQYTPYLQQQPQPQPEMLFQPQPYADYMDFMSFGMLPEDYDESSEISTRPRLTKEQVEVLEAQFQAHPKPNSMVKKQLALQTKLTLPRVANWFQNRRAKAKQQRKQEEFEIAQGMNDTTGWKAAVNQGTIELSSKTSSPARPSSMHRNRSESAGSVSPTRSAQPSQPSQTSTDNTWASLQRALSAAENLRTQHRSQEQVRALLAMPPPEIPRHTNVSAIPQISSQRAQTLSLSPLSDWSKTQNLNVLASPSPILMPAPIQDLGFDFGFDQDNSSTTRSNTAEESPAAGDQHYVVSDDWMIFPGQTSSTAQQSDFTSTSHTSPLQMPTYPGSRRGSGSDELTANLNTFVLAGTPPVAMAPSRQMAAPIRPTDGEIDIASRRKRPRPAALTSASLRSRSYGQLTSTSPAFRPSPPSGNALRHVKSTGHSLNAHYAGIRKSSLPQKSPLNLASFAEAESLQRLMSQQASAATSNKTPLTTPLRPDFVLHDRAAQLGMADERQTAAPLPSEILARYQQLHSPPHTPFQTDYMMHTMNASMPPPSTRAQYASFVECTPPYSAGPLTNSTCWSDAPLHSPDMNGFSSNHFLGSLAFTQSGDPAIQQWILPSEGSMEPGMHQMSASDESKKTEFFITEFPGQKEEYASIAQQVLQPKPKSYVFANTAPSDYDG